MPAACQVAATVQVAKASVATQIAGVIGSCRWTRSKRSSASTWRTRGIDRGESTMLGSEPLAGTTTERPTGMIPAGRSPWRPLRGWRSLVRLPGGSWPITSLTSWPRWRSACAWFSACSTTPPGNDHENGTTIPIFTRRPPRAPGRGGRCPPRAPSRRRPGRSARSPCRWGRSPPQAPARPGGRPGAVDAHPLGKLQPEVEAPFARGQRRQRRRSRSRRRS